jgi:flagellar motor switch protein FliN/FliY
VVSATGGADWVFQGWSEALSEVIASLAGARPTVSVRLMPRPARPAEAWLEADVLWWEQPFSLEGRPAAWVGVPAPVWRQIAMRVMQASELEAGTEADLRNTFLEVLGQAFGGLASRLGEQLGKEVRAEAGHEILEPPQEGAVAEVELSLEGARLPAFWVVLADSLARAPEDSSTGAPLAVEAPREAAPEAAKAPRTLDLLMEVELPVAVSFGRAELPLKDVLKLTTGSIVELNRTVDEPVELIVNNCVIARGEVVVVDGNYGVRIRHIISPQERLRTLK